ncbi:MAG: pyridoxine 5'-phosphate synthase [Verrucomicrobia bacterium]|nr:pyridoxine 5'-phosphate synthase [Verrucomicrobiota bacterium]MDA0858136.1 pyridoxine 5'-phosphate synthase [Verrucomicrobiota bacterium]
MIRLGVNIDHLATLRQARYRIPIPGVVPEPDPASLAQSCLAAGADSITVHLREDRRHIQDDDVLRLGRAFRQKLNLEMAATPTMLDFALRLQPAEVCLVPENRAEVTTEGGLNAADQIQTLRPIVEKLNQAKILTSLFLDPDPHQMEAAATLQAPVVELHTGRFADATTAHRPAAFAKLKAAAEQAHRHNIQVNAGHGLRLSNLSELLSLPHLHTLNIGHSLVSHAVVVGLEQSVRDFVSALRKT